MQKQVHCHIFIGLLTKMIQYQSQLIRALYQFSLVHFRLHLVRSIRKHNTNLTLSHLKMRKLSKVLAHKRHTKYLKMNQIELVKRIDTKSFSPVTQ